jgi:hypothetical protein
MKLIAFIEDTLSMKLILNHLGKVGEAPKLFSLSGAPEEWDVMSLYTFFRALQNTHPNLSFEFGSPFFLILLAKVIKIGGAYACLSS